MFSREILPSKKNEKPWSLPKKMPKTWAFFVGVLKKKTADIGMMTTDWKGVGIWFLLWRNGSSSRDDPSKAIWDPWWPKWESSAADIYIYIIYINVNGRWKCGLIVVVFVGSILFFHDNGNPRRFGDIWSYIGMFWDESHPSQYSSGKWRLIIEIPSLKM